jgi:hypothetical protein
MTQTITVRNKNFEYWLGTGYPGIETGTRGRYIIKRVPGYPFRTLLWRLLTGCSLEPNPSVFFGSGSCVVPRSDRWPIPEPTISAEFRQLRIGVSGKLYVFSPYPRAPQATYATEKPEIFNCRPFVYGDRIQLNNKSCNYLIHVPKGALQATL